MLSLATLDEVQRHNRDDEADEGSLCAKRMLCSRKRRDEDLLEHSKQLSADPLGPASRPRSSFQMIFACPTPAYQMPQKERKKKKKPTNSIRLHKNWPYVLLRSYSLKNIRKLYISTANDTNERSLFLRRLMFPRQYSYLHGIAVFIQRVDHSDLHPP